MISVDTKNSDTFCFPVSVPELRSLPYFFITESRIKYEVRFVATSFSSRVMAFGVINDEYDGEEYSQTNKGEVYRVMNTIIEITNDFIKRNPHVNNITFSCEGKTEKKKNQRFLLYKRYILNFFHYWSVSQHDNASFVVSKVNCN